jgi:crossover junction endodeoxyribonuclease RusA
VIHLTVPGVPVPAARPRTDFARQRIYAPKQNVAYSAVVQHAFLEQKPEGFEPWPKGHPLLLDSLFYFPRPASHYGTGKNAGKLKANAPRYHTAGNNRGDFDNLAKLLADALKGFAWHDDGQVALAHQGKLYVHQDQPEPCATVFIRSLGESDWPAA